MSGDLVVLRDDFDDLERSRVRDFSREIMRELSENFPKLGDFKATREKHEASSFLSRWWNQDELKNAELDSIELQEKMAELMVKMIVLQMHTQHEIAAQQSKLAEQQQALENQAREIIEANEKIAFQQGELSRQQSELKNLVENYFELKGLTAEQGAKLIQYAKKIEAAKDEVEKALIEQQQDSAHQVEKLQAQQQAFQQQYIQQAEQVRVTQENFAILLERQSAENQQVIEAHEKGVEERLQCIDQNVVRCSEKFNQSQQVLEKVVSRWLWFSMAGGVVAISAFILVLVR